MSCAFYRDLCYRLFPSELYVYVQMYIMGKHVALYHLTMLTDGFARQKLKRKDISRDVLHYLNSIEIFDLKFARPLFIINLVVPYKPSKCKR